MRSALGRAPSLSFLGRSPTRKSLIDSDNQDELKHLKQKVEEQAAVIEEQATVIEELLAEVKQTSEKLLSTEQALKEEKLRSRLNLRMSNRVKGERKSCRLQETPRSEPSGEVEHLIDYQTGRRRPSRDVTTHEAPQEEPGSESGFVRSLSRLSQFILPVLTEQPSADASDSDTDSKGQLSLLGPSQALPPNPASGTRTSAAGGKRTSAGPKVPKGDRKVAGSDDYGSPSSILEKFGANGSVGLLSAKWLIARSQEKGFVLPRRQECPPEAFISAADLQQMYEDAPRDDSGPRPPGRRNFSNRLPVVSISHYWRTPEHPDPNGETLRLICTALSERMKVWEDCTYTDMGVFLDFCSLYQKPFGGDSEEAQFKLGLKHVNIWYAHALVTVFLCTETPPDFKGPQYHSRGWCKFEYLLAWMAKLSDEYNVWPQVRLCAPSEAANPSPATGPPLLREPAPPFAPPMRTTTGGRPREWKVHGASPPAAPRASERL
jgi:hypothetical protein